MYDIDFANPEFFYLLLLIPIFILWYILRIRKSKPSLRYSTTEGFINIKKSIRQRLSFVQFIFRILAFSLAVVVLARPQSSSSEEKVTTEGIDIIISLDISGSMKAEDLKPNRLEAAKENAINFIDERINDRIGLVVFAGESFTQCPITIDHDVLKNLFEQIKIGLIDKDGTAIGMGLATAVSRLKESNAKSKVIILMTDGVNNTGFVAPVTASEIADKFGITIYTIGVGTKGKAPIPVQDVFGRTTRQMMDVDIDEETLKKVAAETGGKYFRATDNEALAKIYKEIDEMEKTKVDVSTFNRYSEEFLPFMIASLILLGLEILSRYTIFRTLP